MAHAQYEFLVDYDALGISAVSVLPGLLLFSVISVRKAVLAVLFGPFRACCAVLATVYHASDTHGIAYLEAGDGRADCRKPGLRFHGRERRDKMVFPHSPRAVCRSV